MKPITVALGICFLLASSPARASLVLTLDNPVQTGAPGSVVEFKGSITNTGPEALGLIRVDFDPEVVPPPFETGIPIILLFLFKPAPGQTYTGTVFAVQIDQATIPGQSLETTVTIADPSGRVDPSNAIPVRLTAVPEASAFTLTASGFLMVLAASRRRFGACPSAEKRRKGLVSGISCSVELLRFDTHAVDPERPVAKCS